MSRIAKILNIFLAVLSVCSIYLYIIVPQVYGKIAIGILILTFLFNLVRNRRVSIVIYTIGIGATIFVLYSGFSFASYTNNERAKFDIPTAVIFEKSDFKSALKKAKSEQKNIFIDFYTGWCSPCLEFTKEVMTDREVGEYMNSAFINLKYDAERGEGIEIAKMYRVNSYPTLLILDSDGNVLENVGDGIVPRRNEMIEVSKKYKRSF